MLPDREGLLLRAGCVAQVLVENLDRPALSEDDHRHVAKVLRARAGERISLIDGNGRWRIGEWAGNGVEPASDVLDEPISETEITIYFAPVKGDKPEWTVQKLTELGIDRIVLITQTDHAVVRWDSAKSEKNLARLSRVAYEATMQSRRLRVPTLAFVDGALSQVKSGVAVAQPGGDEITLTTPSIAIGPEGGWSEAELVTGFRTVDLGPTVLRAETAAIAAGVRLSALRG